ncbi:hypothetical protein OAP18_00055 [Gammaproteobacteria bacterium]|nr:hypothetical protein [Gammaproteobacteria bacterium]
MKSNQSKLMLALVAAATMLPALAEAASHRKIVYIDQYDQDLDGRVSSIEFETSRRNRFDLTDTDVNGVVDAEEYVFEWEDRMDAQLAFDRNEQVEQTATRFRSLDDDENGLISWAEFETSGLWSFNRFDSNKDGNIDNNDMDTMAGQLSQSDRELSREQILHDQRRMLEMPSTHNKAGVIAQYDVNDDEVVTSAEYTAGRQAFYNAMDENRDGGVTEDEYLAEFENRLDAELSRFRKGSVEQAYVRYEALDADENNVMTYEEYQYSGHRSFKRWDTDDNGYITYEEEDPTEPEFAQQAQDVEKSST